MKKILLLILATFLVIGCIQTSSNSNPNRPVQPTAANASEAPTLAPCVSEGHSLGAVIPGNTLECCPGLTPYIPEKTVGTRGTCLKPENGTQKEDLDSQRSDSIIGQRNPAANHCVILGYQNEIIDSPKGQNGICRFPDQSSCDDWEFYRGQCGQKFSACTKAGGNITRQDEQVGPSGPEADKAGVAMVSFGLCTFKDGTQCDEEGLLKSECKPGQCKTWDHAGCQKANQPANASASTTASAGFENPAAAHCASLGFKDEVLEAPDGGQSGICRFSDNTTCDDWAFYRGKCGTNFSACVKQGGRIQNKVETDGSATFEYGLCVFKDNTQCGEYELSQGSCKAGTCKTWTTAGCQVPA